MLLKSKLGARKNPYSVFIEKWTEQDGFVIKNNPLVRYSKSDLDPKCLTDDDIEEIANGTNESWVSLKRKGLMMLEEYEKSILPQIEETIEVQKFITLKNSRGDLVRGLVDGIVRFKGYDGVVCLDNKTSSIVYGPDSVKKSEQLGLYQMILENNYGYKIAYCAYAVLHKNLKSNPDQKCNKCGKPRPEGSNVRKHECGGTFFAKQPRRVSTELIIDKIPEEMLDSILSDVSQVNGLIKEGIFEPNFNSCKKPWGVCEFYNFCHNNGDMTGLVKKERSKGDGKTKKPNNDSIRKEDPKNRRRKRQATSGARASKKKTSRRSNKSAV